MAFIGLFLLHALLLVVGLVLSGELTSVATVLVVMVIAAGTSAALIESGRLLDKGGS